MTQEAGAFGKGHGTPQGRKMWADAINGIAPGAALVLCVPRLITQPAHESTDRSAQRHFGTADLQKLARGMNAGHLGPTGQCHDFSTMA
ncbi:hypothetical protein [Paracoccus sp. (in: a-proteobacteria)]|uniref:hypothetical protein n=1 Tax=Paracoccus sp. TaxID=267 RepID=UPI00396C843A